MAGPVASPTCTDIARLRPASPPPARPWPPRAVDPCRRRRPGWRPAPCDARPDQRPPTWSRLATCGPLAATALAKGWTAAMGHPPPWRPQRPAGSTPLIADLRDHRRRGWTHDGDIRPAADLMGRPIRADQRHRARGHFTTTGNDPGRPGPWTRPLDLATWRRPTDRSTADLERSRG